MLAERALQPAERLRQAVGCAMVEAMELFTAIKEGKREEVRAALDRDPGLLHRRDENGLSPILIALYHGEPEIARELLAHGVDLDLFEAAAVGDVERLRAVLASGADPNAYSSDGFTALGLAAFFKHAAVATELLARGADPSAVSRNAMKVAPLHSAVANGVDAAIVRALVDAGADVNVKQRHGWTPLQGAAFAGDAETARLLLDHGAQRDAKNDDGKTAADIAREKGHAEVARLLAG